MIAREQRDFQAAQQWYQKSLEIKERLGNEHGAASTYGQLGIMAGLQENYVDSGRWLIKCVATFLRVNDPHSAQRNTNNFVIFLQQASPEEQAALRRLWDEAGLPPLPQDEDDGAA